MIGLGFRYGGTAWDSQEWAASMAVESLGREVDSVTPRPTASDGTVASKRHDEVSPTSDHTPKPNTGLGIVRAIDITVTVEQGSAWTEFLRQSKDSRLKYVIHNKRMFSSYWRGEYPPFTWRPYTGSNGHVTHIHVSMLSSADFKNGSWGIADVEVQDFRLGGGGLVTVEQLQEALIGAGYDLGTWGPNGDGIDGDLGPTTMGAWVEALSGGSGSAGADGAKGDTGATGATGPKGATGAKGDTGPQGTKGTNGNDGADGKDGVTPEAVTVIVEGKIV